MSQVDPTATRRPQVPKQIDSPCGKLVYLYLEVTDEATTEELADALDISILNLCGLLSTLESLGIVERTGDRYRVVT